jgi:hypothetical protein
LIEPAAMT